MRKAILAASFAVAAAALTGCIGSAPVEAPKSPFFAEWKAPLSIGFDKTDLGTKVGRATNKTYAFGLVSSGDMSVKAAAQNGSIKVIKHVDYEYKNTCLFAYQEITTIVYGD
jgi:hypothetical protein